MKQRIGFGIIFLVAALCSIAFFQGKQSSPPRTTSSVEIPEEFFVKDLDKDLGESFEDNDFAKEKQYISGVVNTFVKFIRDVQAQAHNPTTSRGAHAKALACLKGRFEVQNQNLPENLRVGIFSANKTFNSWIRVSNSSQDPFSKDSDQNTRGFALKLLGVNGPKLMGNGPQDATMDLLNVASEAFVARDNYNYSTIADGTEGPAGLFLRLGLVKAVDLIRAVSKAKAEPNPLRLDYFSTVPYRLGNAAGPKSAIKFRVVLCDAEEAKKYPAAANGPENLVNNIIETLKSTNEVCYNFQIQTGGPYDLVEDATTLWHRDYVTVAKIKLLSRDNPAEAIAGRKDFCEHLSFNPWRTLEAHRPLGRINRARKATYLMSSAYRHHENKTAIAEPDEKSFERIP